MDYRIILLVLALLFVTSCRLTRRSEVNNARPIASPTASPTLIATRLPSPKGYINDFANVFDEATKARLEGLLAKLKEKSNIEFAVATVDSTKDEPIFNFSLEVAREWGIGPGDSSQGGGMLLLLAIKDRRWRLQVSRSLEKDLPNEICEELGKQSEPLYAKGDYAGGAEKYVGALIERLERLRNFNIENNTTTR